MSENVKSFAVAGMITVFTVGSMTLLIKTSKQENSKRSRVDRTEVILKASKPALIRGASADPNSLNPRVVWAVQWLKKMRNKGWSLQAKTSGYQHDTLELIWTTDRTKQDEQHIEDLKKRTGFFDMLRERTFTKLVFKVEGKPDWSKDL